MATGSWVEVAMGILAISSGPRNGGRHTNAGHIKRCLSLLEYLHLGPRGYIAAQQCWEATVATGNAVDRSCVGESQVMVVV